MSHAVEGHETINDFIRNTAAGCRAISFIGFEKGSGRDDGIEGVPICHGIKNNRNYLDGIASRWFQNHTG